MSDVTTSPLSIERAREFFDAQGWKYQPGQSDQAIRTGFSGIGLEISHIAPHLNVVTTVAVDAVGADRFDEVLRWVEQYNNSNAFPTAAALEDPKRNLAAFGATYSLPGFWEYTDEQFAAHLTSGIEGVVGAARDFLRAFAPQVLEDLDRGTAARG